MEHDLSIWGILAMPVGVLLCFGPALIVWLKMELKGEPPEDRPAKPAQRSTH